MCSMEHMQSGCYTMKLCSENEAIKGIIQVMVKDACVDEYYAIMENSSIF